MPSPTPKTQLELTSQPLRMDDTTSARLQHLLDGREKLTALLHEAKGDNSKNKYCRSLVGPLMELQRQRMDLREHKSTDFALRDTIKADTKDVGGSRGTETKINNPSVGWSSPKRGKASMPADGVKPPGKRSGGASSKKVAKEDADWVQVIAPSATAEDDWILVADEARAGTRFDTWQFEVLWE